MKDEDKTGLTRQPEELLGKLSIGRPSGGYGNGEYVHIAVTDEISGTRFLDLRISLLWPWSMQMAAGIAKCPVHARRGSGPRGVAK